MTALINSTATSIQDVDFRMLILPSLYTTVRDRNSTQHPDFWRKLLDTTFASLRILGFTN
jgi:hypothetical protein